MDKKNLSRNSSGFNSSLILGYTYPKLHEGKKTYVDFYALDPARGEMRRVKKFFDHIKNKRERRATAEDYIRKISASLRNGYNPFSYGKTNREYVELKSVFEKYEHSLKKFDRTKTVYSYTSRLNVLREYVSTLKMRPKFAYEFTRQFCVEFLDWLLLDRELSPRTINNYKGWLSSFSAWMMDHKYITENPVEGIKKIREPEKERQPLSADQLKMVFNHLEKTDKHFLLAVLFEYYTFIRPTELSHLKVGDVSVMKSSIYVSGRFSKNRKNGMVALNENLIRLMLELKTLEAPCGYYLFGKNFRPNEDRLGPDSFNKRWAKMRKALKLSSEYKFYSLKDSGIRDLANAKGVVVARDQARHSDISTTNKYLMGRDLPSPEAAKHFDGEYKKD